MGCPCNLAHPSINHRVHYQFNYLLYVHLSAALASPEEEEELTTIRVTPQRASPEEEENRTEQWGSLQLRTYT